MAQSPGFCVCLYSTFCLLQKIPAAHWVQLEKPDEFNAALRRWLDALPINDGKLEEPVAGQRHLADEL